MSKANAQVEVKADVEERQRWAGRFTFYLAAVGAAVGLGNFWRFPYICAKNGGGIFFLPYLMALFLFGIPIILLELGLGQKFQRGDIGVFRGIYPRGAGIGISSVFSSIVIGAYYSSIIAYALYYWARSFTSPLPWTEAGMAGDRNCPQLAAAEEFFMRIAVQYSDENCNPIAPGDTEKVVGYIFLANCITWIIICLCVLKGVKTSSYIVWVTVPLPVLLIIIMIIRGSTLDGASDGVDEYLNGAEGMDQGEMIGTSIPWSDAVGQIFFSLSICMGVMTSYGSYNKREKPVLFDTFAIALTNSAISFMAGFAVFSVVGYLKHNGNAAGANTKSFGLAFIAYPTAASELDGANWWNLCLFSTLYMLGIDSGFSFIEAASTVIYDTPQGRKISRMIIALILCLFCAIWGLLFCSDVGYYVADVVDHYVNIYSLQILGIFQCIAVGWIYETDDIIEQGVPRKALAFFTYSYWTLNSIAVAVGIGLEDSEWVGIIIYFVGLIPIILVTNSMAKNNGCETKKFWKLTFFAGVRKISRHMTLLSDENKVENEWWVPIFEVWWNFSIKYFVPTALEWILIWQLRTDANDKYGEFPMGTQWTGIVCVIVFVILLVAPFWLVTTPEPFAVDVNLKFDEMNAKNIRPALGDVQASKPTEQPMANNEELKAESPERED
jgi:SNF family Na+-dependent transporter